MGGFHVFQLFAGEGADKLVIFDAGGLHGVGSQLFGHDVVFAVCFDSGVFDVRPQADGQVAGQGPGGGGPDDEVGFIHVDSGGGENALVVGDLEFHINGDAGIVGVLDFRLSQRGAALSAPVNRLHAPVDEALLGHFAEHLHLFRLKFGFQGDVGVLKIAGDAQAHELLFLDVHIAHGKFPALAADLGGGGFVFVHADSL